MIETAGTASVQAGIDKSNSDELMSFARVYCSTAALPVDGATK